MSRPRILPFPWSSLEMTTRSNMSALRDVKRWAASHVRLGQFGSSLAELVGSEVEILIGRVRQSGTVSPFGDGVAVLVAGADAGLATAGILIEAEAALAACAVARSLGRTPGVLAKATCEPSADVAGSFAAVLVAAARRAGTALRVLAAGSTAALANRAGEHGGGVVSVSLTVIVGRDAFAARVLLNREIIAVSIEPPWSAHSLMALGALPLALPVVVCATYASVAEVATLGRGDAFIPVARGHWPLSRTASGKAVGPVLLAPTRSSAGLRAELGEDGGIVLLGGLVPLVTAEATMDPVDRDAMAAALGDVPVLVRVEIGEALMSARDWASLGRGDIVPLGRRIGEPVVLRVEGVPIARGDLVDLEGEIGVRIVERYTGGGAIAT